MERAPRPDSVLTRRKRWRRIAVVALLGLFCVALLGSGAMWWRNTYRPQPPPVHNQPLFPGITYSRDMRRLPVPMVIHVVTIDLRETPGLRFLVTPGDPAKVKPLTAQTTTQFLEKVGGKVAINGDFFYPWHSTALWDYYPHVGDPVAVNGLACSNGVVYSPGAKQTDTHTTLHFAKNGRAMFGPLPTGETPYNALSGNQIILRRGAIPAKMMDGGERHPRTAVALDKTGRYLLLIVIDGRQPRYSEGATMRELAEIIRETGGDTALNLDGGGSTTLAVGQSDGHVVVLNSPIDKHMPGRERPVANHLAVFTAAAP